MEDDIADYDRVLGILEDVKDHNLTDKKLQYFQMNCDENELVNIMYNCFDEPQFIYYSGTKKKENVYHGPIRYNLITEWVKENRGDTEDFPQIDL